MTKATHISSMLAAPAVLAAPALALALTFATVGTVTVATTTPVEAASHAKKGKLVLKGIGRIGKGLSRSKVKIVRKAGKGLQKASRKGRKGINRANRKATKGIRKTKLGRKVHNKYRNAQRWQNKQINKAFRNCRGQACNLGKDVAKFIAPM